jgi:hypothetical protein
MQRFFILRLDKDLRSSLHRARTLLYQSSGDPSFLSFEACIILGATDQTILPSWVDAPHLPIYTGQPTYESGTLHLPINEELLRPLRLQCDTTWPTSGVYLGEADVPLEYQGVRIDYVSLAILSVEKIDALFRWHISQERTLYSGTTGR